MTVESAPEVLRKAMQGGIKIAVLNAQYNIQLNAQYNIHNS